MSETTPYRQAVAAIKAGDEERGRALLLESLRDNQTNEMAWVWLARITGSEDKRREIIERILQLNPQNPYALQLKDELDYASVFDADPKPQKLTKDQQQAIKNWIRRGDILVRQGDLEGALDEYLEVLAVHPAHNEALEKSIKYLQQLGYTGDVEELILHALQSGTRSTDVYLTAIRVLESRGHQELVQRLMQRVIHFAELQAPPLINYIDQKIANDQLDYALNIMQQVVEAYPKEQQLILKQAQIQEKLGLHNAALKSYEKAATVGKNTGVGQIAREKLDFFTPILTDKERGKVMLAWREALGVGLFYFLLGWQDAGLSVTQMGFRRWMGVLMAIAGGYLLITATSSPQQQPIAAWLGGMAPHKSDEPEKDGQDNDTTHKTELPIIPLSVRIPMAIVGIGMLIFGFYLVLAAAFILIQGPINPDMPVFDFSN